MILPSGLGLHKPSSSGGAVTGALAHRTTTQTVAAAGTLEPVNWTAEDYDRTAWHDNSSDPSKFVVPAGVSLVQFAHGVKISAVDQADQLKNGSAFQGAGSKRSSSFAGQTMYSAPIPVSLNDYFEGRSARDIAGEERSWGMIDVLDPATQYAVLKKSGNQSISFNTLTAIAWDQEESDADGAHDNVTNNSLITIPSAWNGKYIRFICNVAAATTNGDTQFILQKNANNFDGQFAIRQGPNGTMRYNMASAPILAATGDQYRVVCQNFNTGLSWSVASSAFTWFSVQVLPSTWTLVLAKTSANQSFTGGSPTLVVFDGTNVYGSTALHDPSSSNTRIIVPSGVTQARLGFNLNPANASGTPVARILKNGNPFYGMGYDGAAMTSAAADLLNTLGAWVDVTPGDYFEVELTTGANLTVTGGSSLHWFSGEFR